MYKKILYTLLSIITIFSFAACSGSSDKKDNDTSVSSEKDDDDDDDKKDKEDKEDKEDKKDKENKDDKEDKNDKEDKDDEKDEDDKDDVTPTEAPESTPTEAPKATPTEAPATPTPEPTKAPATPSHSSGLYTELTEEGISTEHFSFQIVGVERNDKDNVAVYVKYENKTDVTLGISIDRLYLNGLGYTAYWSDYIDAGDSSSDTLSFRYSDEDFSVLGDITSLHFRLEATDYQDWDAEPFTDDLFVYYTDGKENAVAYEHTLDADDAVVVSNNQISFTVVDYYYNDYDEYVAKVYAENNTEKSLSFALDSTYVNDTNFYPSFSLELAPGMKGYDEIGFDTEDLEFYQLTDITKVEFELIAYNSDDWDEDYIHEETYVIYPKGKEAATSTVRTIQPTDVVLCDTPECSIIYVGNEHDEYYFIATLYLENKTASPICITADTVLVNGIELNPFMITILDGGKKNYYDIYWNTSSLEDAGITEVTSIELPVKVEDYESWPREEFVNETYTITP